jgi:hypothetical protein
LGGLLVELVQSIQTSKHIKAEQKALRNHQHSDRCSSSVNRRCKWMAIAVCLLFPVHSRNK